MILVSCLLRARSGASSCGSPVGDTLQWNFSTRGRSGCWTISLNSANYIHHGQTSRPSMSNFYSAHFDKKWLRLKLRLSSSNWSIVHYNQSNI